MVEAVADVRAEWASKLSSTLGKDALGVVNENDDLWVRVANSAWHKAVEVVRNDLGCDYFCFLSGLDWLPNPELSGEKVFGALEGEEPAAPEAMTTGVAGGDTRFQVMCRLYSITQHLGVTLKVDLADDNPTVATITDLYKGADWHERETWEMYGFNFDGHPGLRHMYLPGEFEGYPLRKDFPLLAREVKPWPGLVDVEPIPGDSEAAE